VSIGIGQRYNVILIAQPINLPTKTVPKSFWMRAYRPKCFNANTIPSEGYEKAGLVFYDGETRRPDPTLTSPWPLDTSVCADEPYESLHPVVPWQVGKDPAKEETQLEVQLKKDPNIFPLALFSIGGDDFNPLAIDYSSPMALHFNYDGLWNPRWVVYPEDYNPTDWVSFHVSNLLHNYRKLTQNRYTWCSKATVPWGHSAITQSIFTVTTSLSSNKWPTRRTTPPP
jgi:hypothetical protein